MKLPVVRQVIIRDSQCLEDGAYELFQLSGEFEPVCLACGQARLHFECGCRATTLAVPHSHISFRVPIAFFLTGYCQGRHTTFFSKKLFEGANIAYRNFMCSKERLNISG